MRGVADFLAANRCAGRYLLTIAGAMGGIGVVSIVAGYEVMSSAGTAASWWGNLGAPVALLIVLTGWVYYRFRETRALTMAQFFEMRYSRKFRIHAGLLCWLSGLINFGIFPGVAARFFVYYGGLPEHFHIPGIPFAFNTFLVVMAIDLGLALSFVLMGGQISVMITECLQGMFCTIAFVVIIAAIMIHFKYSDMMTALNMTSTPNASMINPFHTGKIKDFNIWFYLIGIFGAFYTQLAWQGTSGFNSSAKSPHEQKMGQIIGGWRGVPQGLGIGLLGLAAIAVLRLPQYTREAAIINHALAQIPNKTIQGQMILPVAMAHILPVGVKGLLGTIMLFISFTCHDTYMHSWGSIFIQDVYMPIKNKVLSPEEHIKILRWSILFVAAFAYIFSWFYRPDQKILMFFAATGTIWLGGAGSVIIGGLYSRWGTTAAAFASLYVGAVLGVLGVAMPSLWQYFFHTECPINSQVLWFVAMITAAVVYYVVSKVMSAGKPLFNLDRMLHRHEYADERSHIVDEFKGTVWDKIVGITSDFSRVDKFLAIFLVTWNMLNFLWFVAFSIVNLTFRISDHAWMEWNWVSTLIQLCLSIPCAVWFTIGGAIDIRALYKHLAVCERDASDDGTVRPQELTPAEAGYGADEAKESLSGTKSKNEG